MGGMTKQAILHRMVMPGHICPYGLKAKHLLESRGFAVDDRWLTTREETDAFKAEHGVKTTPQTFIDGARIGGYDDLRRHFGLKVADPDATSYTPVIALAFSPLRHDIVRCNAPGSVLSSARAQGKLTGRAACDLPRREP